MTIGPHGIIPTAGALRWATHSSVVKQAFGVDLLRAAKAVNPSILTVCRPLWMLRADSGLEAANEVIAFYGRHGFKPDITLLWNERDEIGQRLGQGLERRVDLTAEATATLHAEGLKVGGFSFSTGVPEQADWLYIQGRNFADVDVLDIHCYFSKNGFTLWNGLRWRLIHHWLAGNHPPFIIGETGIDDV